MSTYLLINIIIVVIPLVVTFFEKWIYFRRKLPALFVSIIVVGGLYVGWDILATKAGHWCFNEIHVGEIKLVSIPLEEVLFFVTVPYSCIFTYESLKFFVEKRVRKKSINIPEGGKYIVGTVLLIALFFGIFSTGGYTKTVFLVTAFELLLVWLIARKLLFGKHYWIYIGVTFILFFVFNYALTSLPVVEYGTAEIIGFRILTIPIEDFVYNWGMLTMYLMAYLLIKNKLSKSWDL